MTFTSRISTVHWSSVSAWNKEISWALSETVAAVEAELAKELDLLEVDDHVFDKLKMLSSQFQ